MAFVAIVLLLLYLRHARAAAKAFESSEFHYDEVREAQRAAKMWERSEELYDEACEDVASATKRQQIQFARYQRESVCREIFLAAFLVVLALGWLDLESAVRQASSQ